MFIEYLRVGLGLSLSCFNNFHLKVNVRILVIVEVLLVLVDFLLHNRGWFGLLTQYLLSLWLGFLDRLRACQVKKLFS